MKQLLQGVSEMHKKRILHRDLKPDNILIDDNNDLVIADFGLSKQKIFGSRKNSNSITSLWYRAPEVVLGAEDYLLGVDMWSIGCIFTQMITLEPVFDVSSNEQVLKRAIMICGQPDYHCYQKMKKYRNFNTFKHLLQPQAKLDTSTNVRACFSSIHPIAQDLIEQFLQMNPENRINCKEALEHEFFSL